MVVFYWIPVCIGLSSKNLLERGRLQREGTVVLFAGYVAACRMLETFRHVWDRPSCVFSNFWHWPVNENPPTQPWCVMTFAFAKLRVWISILCGVRFWETAHPSLPKTNNKITSHLGQNVGLGRGRRVVSRMFSEFSSLCCLNTNVRNLSLLSEAIIYLPAFRTMGFFDWSMSKVEGWIDTWLYTCYIVPSPLNRHLERPGGKTKYSEIASSYALPTQPNSFLQDNLIFIFCIVSTVYSNLFASREHFSVI